RRRRPGATGAGRGGGGAGRAAEGGAAAGGGGLRGLPAGRGAVRRGGRARAAARPDREDRAGRGAQREPARRPWLRSEGQAGGGAGRARQAGGKPRAARAAARPARGAGRLAYGPAASRRAGGRAGTHRVPADLLIGPFDPGALAVRLAGPRARVRRGAARRYAGGARGLLLAHLDRFVAP